MQIAEQIPETNLKIEGRLRRALRISLGVTLLAVAVLYILALITLTVTLINSRSLKGPLELYTAPCLLFLRTRNVAFLVVISYLGLNLLVSPKPPVLLLRRFGLDVNTVVSRVIRRGLGRQFRFVTLDDGRFPPLGIPAFERWTTRLGPLVVAIVVVLGASAVRKDFSHRGSSSGSYAAAWYLNQAAAQMSAVISYWIAIFWSLLMLAWVHSLHMRRKSRLEIRSHAQLDTFLLDIRNLSRWRLRLSLLRPQAVVARVKDSLWQQCVSNVAEQLGVVLIDISEPTPNLRWEIERSRRAAVQCVFIAEKDRLQSWLRGTHDLSVATTGDGIAELVGDDCVLLYQGHHKFGGGSFRSSLRQLLRNASRQAPRRSGGRPFPLMDRLWRMSLATIFHVLVLFVAVGSGALLGLLVFVQTTTN